MDRFRTEQGLTIHSTRNVLQPQIERARKFWRRLRKPFTERFGWRLFVDVKLSGWRIQQVVKLAAAARVPYDAIAFLDSDDFLCGNMTAQDYFIGDDLVLLETPARTYEDYLFDSFRQSLTGHSLMDEASCFNYIHTPPRFLRRTVARTLAHLEATHVCWQRAVIAAEMPSEYALLGWTARVLENYAGYKHNPMGPQNWAYVVKSSDQLDQAMETCRSERGKRAFFLIQSNMGDSQYIPRARALIEELAQRQ